MKIYSKLLDWLIGFVAGFRLAPVLLMMLVFVFFAFVGGAGEIGLMKIIGAGIAGAWLGALYVLDEHLAHHPFLSSIICMTLSTGASFFLGWLFDWPFDLMIGAALFFAILGGSMRFWVRHISFF